MPERFTREQPRVAPITATPILVEIEAEYVPLLFSALEKYHNRYYWRSDEDYLIGLPGVIRLERALLKDMSASIVYELQRLYRLWDTSLNGTPYAATGQEIDGLPVVDPPLPAAPPVSTEAANAMRAHLGRLWQLGENAATGAAYAAGAGVVGSPELPASLSWAQRLLAVQGETGGFFGLGAQPVTLAALLQAGRVNNAADEGVISDTFEEVLGVISQGGNVGTALASILGAGTDLASDGGIMAIQAATLAATLAQATAQGATQARLIAELSRLNTFLSGADAGLLSPALPRTAVLLDPEQGLSITQWLVANTAAAQAIKAYISQGIDPTTIQSLLQGIYAQLGGAGGGGGPAAPVNVTLDPVQLAALTDLLECICVATSGPPTPPPAGPQFDELVCGIEWDPVAVWRPTTTGTSLTYADGEWDSVPGASPGFVTDQTTDGFSVIRTGVPVSPAEMRVVIAVADGYTAVPTGVVQPREMFVAQDGGRPNLSILGPGQCWGPLIMYQQDAQGDEIGYAVNLSVGAGDEPLSPDNVAVYLLFAAFG